MRASSTHVRADDQERLLQVLVAAYRTSNVITPSAVRQGVVAHTRRAAGIHAGAKGLAQAYSNRQWMRGATLSLIFMQDTYARI